MIECMRFSFDIHKLFSFSLFFFVLNTYKYIKYQSTLPFFSVFLYGNSNCAIFFSLFMKYNLCYYIRISFLILSLNVIVTKNGTAHKRKTSLTKGPLIDLKMCVHVDKSWNLNGEWEEKCEIARFCPVIVDRLTDYLLFGSIQNYFPTKCMRVCVYLKSIGNNRDVLLVVTDYYY